MKEIIWARETTEKHVPNLKVTNYFEILARDVTDLNFNSNLVMVPTNSLVTTSHINPFFNLKTTSSMDHTNSNMILTTSRDTITNLVPSRNLDLAYSNNPASRPSPDSVLSSNLRSSKALFIPWKCEICEATIPWGLTFEQTLHVENHKKQNSKCKMDPW